MAGRDYQAIRGPLLEAVERLVVAEHRALFEGARGERWSRPRAYHWIRYEDPDPVARLLDAERRLAAGWRGHEAARERFAAERAGDLAAALELARALGYRG